MNSTICQAIANRSVIEFTYGGGHRVVEPHTHGISTAGNEVLRAYPGVRILLVPATAFLESLRRGEDQRTVGDFKDLHKQPTRLRP